MGLIKRMLAVENMLKPEQRLGEIAPSKEYYQTFFRLAWPSALETVLVSLIGSLDTIMVGGLGHAAIAAIGITNQPKFILLAMIFSLNVGVTAIVARRKGQQDQKGANGCLKQGILICFIISTIMALLGYIFARPILEFAGAESDSIDYAVSYFQILMPSIVFLSLSLTINAAQRGVGNTKIAMRTNLVANIVNVIFNYFLINGVWFFPRLEVRGAALATLIGNIVGCLMSLRSILGQSHFLHLDFKSGWGFDKKTLSSIANISGSAMVEQVFMRIGFFSYAKIVADLGTVAFATHQICMQIINISFAFGDGLGIAASSLVGQRLGAKRTDEAIIYGKTGQRIAFFISTFLFLLFLFGGRGLVWCFSREEEILNLGAIIMIIVACTTHVQTSQVVFSGCLRGSGDTKFVAFTSLLSIGIIRPLLSYVLCFPVGMGLIGAWIGLLVDQGMRFCFSLYRFNSAKWTKIEV